jgi:5S rRNA maturation endonuclease (ribonuclease M5)
MEALAFLLGWYKVLSNGDVVCDWRRAIEVAGKYTVESLDAYRERAAEEARKDPLPSAIAVAYNTLLCGSRSARMQWFYDRGLQNDSILRFALGHDGTRFTIPFYDGQGRLLTIRFRRDDYFGLETWDGRPLPKYSGIAGRNGLYLFGGWLLKPEHVDVVVCEGELDAVRLWQEGVPAVSPTNGAGNVKHVARLLEAYPWVKRLWIASDMDEPGELAALELQDAAEYTARFDSFIRLRWPREQGKDVTEFYQSGHRLEDVGWRQIA